jgi:hypothetical protein
MPASHTYSNRAAGTVNPKVPFYWAFITAISYAGYNSVRGNSPVCLLLFGKRTSVSEEDSRQVCVARKKNPVRTHPQPPPFSHHIYSTSDRELKPNSWMYNFVEVSGHNIESFRIQCLH